MMDCREVREYLPAYVDEAGGPRAESVERHLSTCPECRTELGHFREMKDALATLPARMIEPPAWLLGTLTETVVQKAARREAMRNTAEKLADPKVIVTGSLVAAGVAGALLIRGRRRRRRTVTRRFREALAEA